MDRIIRRMLRVVPISWWTWHLFNEAQPARPSWRAPIRWQSSSLMFIDPVRVGATSLFCRLHLMGNLCLLRVVSRIQRKKKPADFFKRKWQPLLPAIQFALWFFLFPSLLSLPLLKTLPKLNDWKAKRLRWKQFTEERGVRRGKKNQVESTSTDHQSNNVLNHI